MRSGLDRIAIRGLRVFAHHGVLESERTQGQNFLIDVTVHLDTAQAAAADDLSRTLDYGGLALAVHQRVSEERWNLIERVAQRVAELVLENPVAERVEVTVRKPEAPIPVPFDEASVSITRSRPGVS